MQESWVQSLGQEDPLDGGAWWATVHGVTKSQTGLTDFTFTFNEDYILKGGKNVNSKSNSVVTYTLNISTNHLTFLKSLHTQWGGSPPKKKKNLGKTRHHPRYRLSCIFNKLTVSMAQLVKNPPAMRDSRVGKIPWRRERLPTPVFWPEEVHGLYFHGVAESDMTEWLSL